MRFKKILVFILVILAVYGFVTVDESYSDMLDKDGHVGLNVRRVNSEYVTISIFGKTGAINTRELREDWGQFSDAVVSRLEGVTDRVKSTLGIKEEERDYNVFKLQML